MILSIFILGILGGRLVYVLTNIDNFRTSYLDIFCIWKGGMGIFGVLAGGITGYLIFWVLHFRKKIAGPGRGQKLSFFVMTDIAAVLIPLGQATGRWANFINQELFGPPANLPWSIYIDPEHRPSEYKNNEFFHPAFLYESILNFMNFIILRQIFRNTRNSLKKGRDGVLTSLYLINYGIIRIVVERFRIDTDPAVLGLKLADIASLVMISAGLGILIFKYVNSDRYNLAKANKTQTLTKIASFLTNIFSPLTSSLLMIVILYLNFIPHSLHNAGIWFAIIIGSFSVAVGILYFFLKTGRVSNWDITDRKQRPKVFALFFVIMVLVLLITSYLGYNQATNYLILATTGFGLTFAITTIWKISIHTFSVALFVCVVLHIYGKPWIVVLFIIPLITAWTRIHLKRHTVSQAAGGIAIALTVFLFWLIVNFDVTSAV